MAYLAIRGSGAVNGVSRLHGQVSRRIFQPLVPEVAGGRSARDARDQRRAHAHLGFGRGGLTCGKRTCGKDRWRETTDGVEECIRKASDSDLWQLRTDGRKSLVQYVRKRHARQLAERGASAEELAAGRASARRERS